MIYQSLRFYIHVNGLGYKFTPTYIYIYIYILWNKRQNYDNIYWVSLCIWWHDFFLISNLSLSLSLSLTHTHTHTLTHIYKKDFFLVIQRAYGEYSKLSFLCYGLDSQLRYRISVQNELGYHYPWPSPIPNPTPSLLFSNL